MNASLSFRRPASSGIRRPSLGLRRPAAAGVLVGLLIVLAWWQLLWKPQSAQLNAARQQQNQATADLVTASQKLGHLKHLQLISPQLTALEQQIDKAIPANDDLDAFLLDLDAEAQAAGVQLLSISPSAPSGGAGYSAISLQLSMTAPYFSVQRFLDELRTGNRLVVIDSLTENPQGSSAVSASLTAHILTGLAPESRAAAKAASTPTTAAPSGIISGPVSRAHSAVNALNQATAEGH